MEMTVWYVLFGVLQAIMIFSLSWFIRLLFRFSNDLKSLESRINTQLRSHENRISQLEKEQAVDGDRWRRLDGWMEKVDNKLDRILEN